MGRDFLYLVAIMGWHSEAGRAWHVSNTMNGSFRVLVLDETLARFGRPEISSRDQGSQFATVDFSRVLTAAGLRSLIDGKGPRPDTVLIEQP